MAAVFAAQLALNYPSNLQLEGPSFWSCEALGRLPTPPKAKAGTGLYYALQHKHTHSNQHTQKHTMHIHTHMHGCLLTHSLARTYTDTTTPTLCVSMLHLCRGYNIYLHCFFIYSCYYIFCLPWSTCVWDWVCMRIKSEFHCGCGRLFSQKARVASVSLFHLRLYHWSISSNLGPCYCLQTGR